ncbi:FMN-dependent NADH-azoreductase [Legionella cherrii]|uniref:FMN dependent NADH:quinone oxidoreductase n=1 Tax=Legionella cherrii TaxID=28084 RepID=A0A0W0SB19_9GAMM|nr:NAD(P)H-dependent oxidoreductase [Legionella cherrii]KTC80632.1 ACP phosphodiesterase [Legionella cherrii]VEB34655.1 ACP phosphodiesterase [Legionella cherrii]
MKLLALDSSILEAGSVSRQLMTHYLNHWQRTYPTGEVIYRDLDKQGLSHLSSESLIAAKQPETIRSEALKNELALAEMVLHEFLSADEIVIGAPMYNFSIPSQLKSWIDRILVAGKTFKYTGQGVMGLAGDKRVIILSTRGNFYTNNASMQAMDHQEYYLQVVFNFIGVTRFTVIRAEGLHLSPEIKTKAIALAEEKIEALFL